MQTECKPLSFLGKRTISYSFSKTNNLDKELFQKLANKLDLPENTNFSKFVRRAVEEALKSSEIQTQEVIKEVPVEVIKEVEKIVPKEIVKEVFKAPENAVCIPITAKMQKCFDVRKAKGMSENLDEMCKQAISFCTSKPTGNLFTNPW